MVCKEREFLLVDLCCGGQVEDMFGHGQSQSMQTRINCF